jgi:hypothetical protein
MEVRIGQMDTTVRATAPAVEDAPVQAPRRARTQRVRATLPPAALEADRRLRTRLTADETRREVGK